MLLIFRPNGHEGHVYRSFENLLNRWRHDPFFEHLSEMASFSNPARYFHSETNVLDEWIPEELINVIFKKHWRLFMRKILYFDEK